MAGEFDRVLLEEARAITVAAREESIRLRLLGALGIHLHCAGWEAVEDRLGRLGDVGAQYTDLDLAAYGKERHLVRTLLEDRFGLRADAQAILFHGKERLLYAHPEKRYRVDVFFDRLTFSHTIDLGAPGSGRLDLDFPTLTPADLLLSKIQIHAMTEKDVKDVVLLLRAHALANGDGGDAISVARVAGPLADDWGFWKDATGSLTRVRETLGEYVDEGLLAQGDATDVSDKVNRLLAAIEATPKTRAWRRGERTLAHRQWWSDVESVVR